ncbi:IclR family transcriptional regulator [Leucobacter massiliensis]|uniref:IclR family transcriptional regulator n=1 Tax=Leucobacter massiliensis TaxID=1686285 RepID=A0A2S9QS99_9MICO|nr:helix-turn-helix domain-containing protein [Leucobacter massiliensis]PRI12448.1 hypothetical protein B4915_01920 [Leucobacter massiliensis]
MSTDGSGAALPSALRQGAALLSAVADRERSGRAGLSASRLAEQTGIERSRTSRLTQELVELGFLQRDEDATFRAGPAYFELAASRQEEWLRAARGALRSLVARFRVSARVLAADGPRAVLLRLETASGAPETAATPGMVTPIWCTGGGRALLWLDSRARLEERLRGVEFVGVGGPRAAHSAAGVWELMERDRARGFVSADQEFEYGVREIAAPVLVAGRLRGAVSVACRSDDADLVPVLGEEVRAVAKRLGSASG